MRKKRLVTGITSSGSITIGNYFGSLKGLKKYLDDGYELFVFVADVHAMTIPQKITSLEIKKNSLELLLVLNALGINNETKNCNVFIQSQHLNLNMGMLCQLFTSIGELERMTQYKTKKLDTINSNKTSNIPTGLLTYPTLMAADILLYLPDIVPVGLDQKQHLELTKTIAERINKRMCEDFLVIPDFVSQKVGGKIKSLTDPSKKMSKSDKNENSSIFLFDTLEEIEKKISKSKTDSFNIIKENYQEEQPGVSNLLDMYYLCNNRSKKILDNFINEVNDDKIPYKKLKSSVFESLKKELLIVRESISDSLDGEISRKAINEKLNRNSNWVPDFMKTKDWKTKNKSIKEEANKNLKHILEKLGFII